MAWLALPFLMDYFVMIGVLDARDELALDNWEDYCSEESLPILLKNAALLYVLVCSKETLSILLKNVMFLYVLKPIALYCCAQSSFSFWQVT